MTNSNNYYCKTSHIRSKRGRFPIWMPQNIPFEIRRQYNLGELFTVSTGHTLTCMFTFKVKTLLILRETSEGGRNDEVSESIIEVISDKVAQRHNILNCVPVFPSPSVLYPPLTVVLEPSSTQLIEAVERYRAFNYFQSDNIDNKTTCFIANCKCPFFW